MRPILVLLISLLFVGISGVFGSRNFELNSLCVISEPENGRLFQTQKTLHFQEKMVNCDATLLQNYGRTRQRTNGSIFTHAQAGFKGGGLHKCSRECSQQEGCRYCAIGGMAAMVPPKLQAIGGNFGSQTNVWPPAPATDPRAHPTSSSDDPPRLP